MESLSRLGSLCQGTFRQLVRLLLCTQLPGGGQGSGPHFFRPGVGSVSLIGHTGQFLLQLLDPRHQRSDLPLSRGRLSLPVVTAKTEILRLRAPRRQKLVGVGEQLPLTIELVPDAPLPPKEQRLPERPGLELLDRQNTS